jgi:uncharacterized membrane protein HdeD (DUF308 family)
MSATTFGRHHAAGGAGWEWLGILVLGVATVVLGLVLMTNPFASAHTLAVLVAIGLIADGLIELVRAGRSPHRMLAVLSGAVLVFGGFVALVWPQITLWALAVLAGASIFLGGAFRTTAAIADRHSMQAWPWLLISGLFGLLIGFVAVLWPKATVVVLAVLFGLQITIFGVIEIVHALTLRRVSHGAY